MTEKHDFVPDFKIANGVKMAYIKLKLARKLTTAQKRKIIKGFSEALTAATGKPDKSIRVVIEENSVEKEIKRKSVDGWERVAWLEESLYYFSRDYN